MVCQKIKQQAAHKIYTHFCIAAREMTAGEAIVAKGEGVMLVREGKAAQCGHK